MGLFNLPTIEGITFSHGPNNVLSFSRPVPLTLVSIALSSLSILIIQSMARTAQLGRKENNNGSVRAATSQLPHLLSNATSKTIQMTSLVTMLFVAWMEMASTSHTLDGFSLRLELLVMAVLVLVLPAVVNVVLLWKYSLPGDEDVYSLADGVISDATHVLATVEEAGTAF